MTGTDSGLGAQLRQLREAVPISGRSAAQAAGLSQSRLSRIERDRFVPTEHEVQALCALYGVPRPAARELQARARAFQQEQAPARVVLHRGAWRLQERIERIEHESRLVRGFQPAAVIGLLQTPAYMRHVFGAVEGEEHAERMSEVRARRQAILDSQREFVFVMSEGALRWNLGGPHVMVEQLEHLAGLTRRGNIRLGVIPWTTTAPLPPFHAFHLYDAGAAIVGSLTATAILTNDTDLADYTHAFTQLENAASFGDDARSIIERITGEYRSLR